MKIKFVHMTTSAFAIIAALSVIGCGKGDSGEHVDHASETEKAVAAPVVSDDSPVATSAYQVDVSSFANDALVKPVSVVDCTLSTGEAARCAQITVKYKPDGLQIGPFCPETVDLAGGIWNWDGKDAGLYRIDGKFLRMLKDQGYAFFGADGKVQISGDIAVKPAFKNTCMSMQPAPEVTATILLPMTPKMANTDTQLGTVAKVGIALDGVPIFADAPSVLETGHMPALDLCGGHIDPGGWYHWHATATDINALYARHNVDASCALQQSASAQFAYAYDGYPMYGTADSDGKEPTNLDQCNGHTGVTSRAPAGEYHYHATSHFPNLPTCLKGVQANNNFSTTASTGIGSANGGGGPGGPRGTNGGPRPNFAEAAAKLGVSESALQKAMQDAGGRNANLSQVAKALNVSEAALQAALPKPER